MSCVVLCCGVLNSFIYNIFIFFFNSSRDSRDDESKLYIYCNYLCVCVFFGIVYQTIGDRKSKNNKLKKKKERNNRKDKFNDEVDELKFEFE